MPGLRSFVAVPAGIRKMPVWEFFGLNLVGTVFWTGLLFTLGYILGDNYRVVDQYSSYISYAVLAIFVCLVAYRLYKGVQKRREQKHAQA